MKLAITGGASGIGAKTVSLLQSTGHELLVFDLHEPAAEVAFIPLDLMNGDGSWSKSSFAPPAEEFEDENFILRHTGPGVLSMCNRGPNTNGSAFFLSFVELPWMNENHVVFGCVANTESLSVLYEIEHAGTECGRPSSEVLILDCGQLYPL